MKVIDGVEQFLREYPDWDIMAMYMVNGALIISAAPSGIDNPEEYLDGFLRVSTTGIEEYSPVMEREAFNEALKKPIYVKQ